MAKGSIAVDMTSLQNVMEQYKQVTGKSMGEIVRAHARLCCVELANRTNPFTVGGGSEALDKGTHNLGRDIRKAIKEPDDVAGRAERFITDDKTRLRVLALIAAGRWNVVARIFANLKILSSPDQLQDVSGETGMKATHKLNRSKSTGRTSSPRKHINKIPEGLEGYIGEVSKMIGYTKSGWAECARKIGRLSGDNARGIPAFAKRQKQGNFDVEDHSGDKDNPHFIMTNTTPWVSKMIKESEITAATNIASGKMIKSMERVLQHAAKQKADIAAITKQEVQDA
jgi:hypothetical protein